MSLIERYLMREISRLVLLIVGFLIFMFVSYSAQRYLTEAANGTLALQVVADVVFYKTLIALEMLLPIGLYVSVAIVLSQLYSDSEITAINASGFSLAPLYKSVIWLSIPLSIGVMLLSMYGRPWSYGNIYKLEQQSQSVLDVSHLQADKFNINDNGSMVLASRIDAESGGLQDVLIYSRTGKFTRLYRADSMKVLDASPENPLIDLKSGSAYTLDRTGVDDAVQGYKNLQIALKPVIESTTVKRKSASIAQLSSSTDLEDQAELQWRITRGISTILMVLLAVPLSRTKPRQGRYATLLPLTIVFIAIYYGGNICRTLVGNGSLPLYPGLWLVPLAMLLGILCFIKRDLSSQWKSRR